MNVKIRRVFIFILTLASLYLYSEEIIQEEVSVKWWIVPLIATDSKGNPVENLKRDDIEVYVNKKKVNDFILYKKEFQVTDQEKRKDKNNLVKPNKPMIFLVIDNILCSRFQVRKSRAIAQKIIRDADPLFSFVLMSIEPFIGLKYHTGPTNDRELLEKTLRKKIKMKATKGRCPTRNFLNALKILNLCLKIFRDQGKIIYFFSQGMGCSLEDLHVWTDSAETLKSCGSMLFVINPIVFKKKRVTERKTFLRQLVKATGGRYYDGQQEEIVQDIKKVNRSYYEIAFPYDLDEESGAHSILIKSRIPGITISSIREISRGKQYKEMDSIEKELLALNIVADGYWAKNWFKIIRTNPEKKITGRNTAKWVLKIPQNFTRKEIDFYTVKFNNDKKDAKIRKKTIITTGRKIIMRIRKIKKHKDYQKAIVAIDNYSKSAVVYR